MNAPKFTLIIPLITVMLGGFNNYTKAQVLSCENLQAIVKAIAKDSTLKTIKGEMIKEAMDGDSAQYMSLIPIWDYLDDLHGEYIRYDKTLATFVYNAYSINQVTVKEEKGRAIKALENCLGTEWISQTAIDEFHDSITYFKNPASYLTISIGNHEGSMQIKCYHEPKNISPVCVSGDCHNFYGGIRFSNNDTYTGTFIDGTLSGIGHANWYAAKKGYQGSFIDNQLAGYGTVYDENKQVVKKGFFFNGDTVILDRQKSGCQYGDCEDGFGVKLTLNDSYIYADVYIGYFKGGLPEGLGETVTGWRNTQTMFFGHYKKGIADGTGIFIDYNGNMTFGDYINKIANGNYLTALPDKTVIQGNYNDNTLSYFDENNILTKAGKIRLAFVENTDPVYLETKAAAKSIKKFYNYRQSDYKEIFGGPAGVLNDPNVDRYKSKMLFQDLFETNIITDYSVNLYVTVNLSGKSTDKLTWIKLYNKYYKILDKALGNQWRAATDNGLAGTQRLSSTIVLRNIFDLSKSISLSINQKGVQMEIH